MVLKPAQPPMPKQPPSCGEKRSRMTWFGSPLAGKNVPSCAALSMSALALAWTSSLIGSGDPMAGQTTVRFARSRLMRAIGTSCGQVSKFSASRKEAPSMRALRAPGTAAVAGLVHTPSKRCQPVSV